MSTKINIYGSILIGCIGFFFMGIASCLLNIFLQDMSMGVSPSINDIKDMLIDIILNILIGVILLIAAIKTASEK